MQKRPHHEKLPKDSLQKGNVYTLLHNEAPAYEAEIVKYGGGCWATVRVTDPLDNTKFYKPGDEFDIRVAMYEYAEKSVEKPM